MIKLTLFVHSIALLSLSKASILIPSLFEALTCSWSAEASQVDSLGILLIKLVQHISDACNRVTNLAAFRPKLRDDLHQQLLNLGLIYLLQVLLVLEELLLVWVHGQAAALVLILEFIIAALLTIIMYIATSVAMLIWLILLVIILILPLLLVVLSSILPLSLAVPAALVMVISVLGAFGLVYWVILLPIPLPILLLIASCRVSRGVVRLVCGS